jgi:hypothetical protein
METGLSVQDRSLQFLQFKYSTLESATECFNEAHKLGQGGYGEVFKVYIYICTCVCRLKLLLYVFCFS